MHHIHVPLGLECYCYNEPNDGFGICHWEGDRCTGDICYVHKVLQDGVYYSSWNCLIESVHHIDPVCNKGSFNTATEEYICCSDRDNCNENIRIELPIERPQPVSTNAVTSAPGLAVTTIEGSLGSGSGDITLDPSMISTEGPDLLPESTTSRSTPVSSHPTSRQPSTSTTSRTPTTPAVSRPSATTAPTGKNLVSPSLNWLSMYPHTIAQEELHTHGAYIMYTPVVFKLYRLSIT